MKLRLVAATAVVAMALAACAAQSAPLTLEQRVPSAEDAPGSEPDPRETQVIVTGIDKFEAEIASQGGPVTEEDVQALEEAGFVTAIRDTRFYPTEEGHAPGAVHVFSIVLQFDSSDSARQAVELMQEFNLRTCPETCAYTSAEFDVNGIPDALGAQQIATQESLDEVGDPGEPQALYAIDFADGPFVYDIVLAGPPEEVSEEDVAEIASSLYERVKGAPPADSD
jgi:hypothetical protein